MKKRVDLVRSCESCPYSFRPWRAAYYVCAHDDHGDPTVDGRYISEVFKGLPLQPPEWCPLRKGETVVRLAPPGHPDAGKIVDEE